jgi:hypothetical protein
MMNKPDGYTIFCDDIRQEVGNKCSLMGVYGPEMYLSQPFPSGLPRMGFHVVFKEDLAAPLKDMTLCIFLPGDPDSTPTYRADIERSSMKIEPSDLTPGPSTWRLMSLNVILTPVALKQEGRIKVRMLIGDDVVKLGALGVKYRAS